MEIRNRNEIPVQDTWRLEDMFETDSAWETEFSKAKTSIEQFEQYAGTLSQSIGALKKALDVQSDLELMIERLYVYAMMRRDEDNSCAQYQALADRAMSLAVLLSAATSFFVPELLEIDPAILDGWRQEKELAIYAHTLDDIVRNRDHVLSHLEERLLSESSEIASAPQTIYKMLDYADIRFPTIQTKEGDIEITSGNYIHLMEDEDRQTRKKAFEGLYSTYEGLENTFAATLSYSVKNDIFQSKVRKFPNATEASLFEDHVPVSVYDSLIQTVHENLPLMYQYIDLRKKALGVDQVHLYDLYAPLSKAEFSISYPEAQEMVLAAVKPLGTEYGDVLKSAFKNRWIDVYENRGKTNGAYSWGCYGTHPYVLMNYQNNIDSVFTLAHEMGHAMHTWFSDKNQLFVNAQYKILIAEVASTVNECLLLEYLLERETDCSRRLRLLNYYLEQFRGTVYRQVMFAEFEKQIHEVVEQGGALTSEQLKEIYLSLNRLYYGPDMVLDDGIAMEWARISHFYNAFYVYKYATGFSSAVALSNAILTEQDAPNRYLTFLSSGGSDYPLEILKRAGVDLNSSKPIQRALGVFERALHDLEKLL